MFQYIPKPLGRIVLSFSCPCIFYTFSFFATNLWSLEHADSIWSCWWLMVYSMSDSPLCSGLSYFLGELEKCVAEPERLAQLFIKHVSLSIILTFICLSVSSKVEQNFLLHWVNRTEKTQGFLTRTLVLTPHLFSHHPTLFLTPSDTLLLTRPIWGCVFTCVVSIGSQPQGKKRREK